MNNSFQKGVVTKIEKHFVFVDFEKIKGRMHISEASDYFVGDLSKVFTIGKSYEFVIDFNANVYEDTYEISFKKTVPWSLKTSFKFEIQQTPSGFTNLRENTLRKLTGESND